MSVALAPLTVTGLTLTLGGRRILDDLTASFEPGIHVISGPSGVGKTSLLNVIVGYTQPDSGTIALPGPVSYLFQDELLFTSLTVAANLRIRLAAGDSEPAGPRASNQRSAPTDTAEDSALAAITSALTRVGIDALVEQPVSALSGGERQRLQLAGILLDDPGVVLLDEPTSKLDPANRALVAGSIANVFAGRIVIVVAHDDFAAHVPEAVRLELTGGRLRDLG
ncbi:MAG TPA: ATP-binding cassette domain-containing protein [Dermatophilaceae bacterium]|nr:ATP-binding cassette domain-containing protein [Dermatophilaceae bacterium]